MKVTLFFDLEGWYGYPHKKKFDFPRTIKAVSDILDKFKAKAAFNTCGALVEEFPQVIRKLFDKGHEISLHAYKHEFFLRLSTRQINDVLCRTEKIIKQITGQRPIGLRCPFFYYDSRVFTIFKKRRYKWLSNECFLPRLASPLKNQARLAKWRKELKEDKLLVKMRSSPFINSGILEIPLLSHTDVCLLGYTRTGKDTPKKQLDSVFNLLRTEFLLFKNFFNLNFHCWCIGTANRIILLEKILQYLSRQPDVEYILPRNLLLEVK